MAGWRGAPSWAFTAAAVDSAKGGMTMTEIVEEKALKGRFVSVLVGAIVLLVLCLALGAALTQL